MPETAQRLARIERQLEAVVRRLEGIESRSDARDPVTGAGATGRSEEGNDQGTLSIAGSIRQGQRRFNFQQKASLSDVLSADPETVASLFAALGSPFRVRLLRALMEGPQATQDLQAKLDEAAPGQLYHHLKELLTAGLIAQRGRGLYAIREEAVMPVLLAFVVAPRLTAHQRPVFEEGRAHLREVK